MPYNGTLYMLKNSCVEPCEGGNNGGGGVNPPPFDFQPQIDKINDHLNQNDAKLTTHDVEIANLNKKVTDNKNDVDLQINTLSSMTTDSINELKQKDVAIEQSIRNINNDLNNNYVTKLELSDETDKLNKRIDGITGGGGGIDYQPQIDALKEKDKQIEQKTIDNSGNIQLNTTEINNIKTNYVTNSKLAQTQAEISKTSNDYTDAEIKKVKTDVDTNRNLITNIDTRVQTLENNQGGGTGGGSTNLDSFILISVSIQDGNVNCLAYNPNTAQQYNNVDWGIVYKYSFFDGRSFTGVTSKTISDRSFSYDNFTDKVLFINARISATINGTQYIAGLKQTMFNNGDVDYVAGSTLKLIALRS